MIQKNFLTRIEEKRHYIEGPSSPTNPNSRLKAELCYEHFRVYAKIWSTETSVKNVFAEPFATGMFRSILLMQCRLVSCVVSIIYFVIFIPLAG